LYLTRRETIMTEALGCVTFESVEDHIRTIRISRPAKRNAFTPKMVTELVQAFEAYEADSDARVAILCAEGDHFTAGLDLEHMADEQKEGKLLGIPGRLDPLGLTSPRRTKPVLVATEGFCFTIGVELILASDVAVAGESSVFTQIEVQRAIMAYGGATVRLVQRAGWGNAMKILLTGDRFDANTALDYGIVQEVVADGGAFDAAVEIARRIAAAAPGAVLATLANARLAVAEGEQAAFDALPAEVKRLAHSADAAEGVTAFIEKRTPRYSGE
jgi:enoyl-CoA hydratase/carnithine racemase